MNSGNSRFKFANIKLVHCQSHQTVHWFEDNRTLVQKIKIRRHLPQTTACGQSNAFTLTSERNLGTFWQRLLISQLPPPPPAIVLKSSKLCPFALEAQKLSFKIM
jgi:hypothetical protein